METVEENEADVERLEVSFVPEDHILIQVSFSVSHTTGDRVAIGSNLAAKIARHCMRRR